MDVITGINIAIETLKKLKEVNESIKNAEIKMIIADLSLQLSEAKMSISELLDKNRELQEEITSLKSEQSEALIFRDDVYFDKNGDGPYCPGCYDEKKRKHRLIIIHPMYHKLGVHKCVVCDKRFNLKKG